MTGQADMPDVRPIGHVAMKDVPIDLTVGSTRYEFNSLGSVEVPANNYYGAQAQRSLIYFSIGATACRRRSVKPTVLSRRRAR